ncbi:MAG TPA: UbiA family prenyltransferase [Candidatus Kapabacteria bacterium]|nr:UbiA family prenyltransferase [Candidatus Kapabacteria bacterium]
MNNDMPLCVDLDGTLIKTDLMLEAIPLLLKQNPIYILFIICWAFKGRLFLKEQLSKRVQIDFDTIPINEEVRNYLIEEKKQGRIIYLVTAAVQEYADVFQKRFKFFDDAIGSGYGINLTSTSKANYLVNRFGEKGYDYVGDTYKDLAVWKHSNNALIVSNDNKLVEQAKKISKVTKVFDNSSTSTISILIQQFRVFQWVKNLLIFTPSLLAHNTNFNTYIDLIIAFLSFSCIASSIYIFNDLMDLKSDRLHFTKKYRPLAAGNFKISNALLYSFLLIIIGFTISLNLSYHFTLVLIIYSITTFLYTSILKGLYLIDIITLALLYILRLEAGAVVSDNVISEWLIVFALFFFFSMGALKRFAELKNYKEKVLSGRGYIAEDIHIIQVTGISSSMIAILIIVFYINSPNVMQLYQHPKVLYLIVPVFLYWCSRLWLLADRKQMNDDPIAFAVKDKVSYICILMVAVIMIMGLL